MTGCFGSIFESCLRKPAAIPLAGHAKIIMAERGLLLFCWGLRTKTVALSINSFFISINFYFSIAPWNTKSDKWYNFSPRMELKHVYFSQKSSLFNLDGKLASFWAYQRYFRDGGATKLQHFCTKLQQKNIIRTKCFACHL